jgi:hypothetical protein
MSRFGWAYVSDLVTGSGGTPGGSDKAIQFASGSTFSGSTNFTFDYTSNTVRLTGTLYADNLIVSSSTIFKSGSTKFGDDLTDTHQFTGSVSTNNNLTVIGQVSASVALNTAGTIQAGSNITSFGIISGSSFLSNGNITSNGIISSSGGLNTGGAIVASGSITSTSGEISASVGLKTAGTITAGSIISSSAEIRTNSSITASSNIISTAGFVSASNGLYSGDGLTVAGSSVLRNGLTVTGSSFVQALSSSAQIQATSFRGDGLNITGVLASNTIAAGNDWNVQYFDANTGYITGSSNLLFSGSTLTLTGSFLMTGSSTFVNIGPTILSGNLNVTGAITGNNAFLSGGLSVGNYIQMLPVGNVVIPTNQTASYIYTSGSTNDLYFTQYQPGTSFSNTTRLRWLESSLATGHQHGGILSTVTGTTTFSLTAGSGLIVDQNASLTDDSYPTIIQVNWPAYVSQSLTNITSSQITYISVNASGAIQQSTTAPTITQYRDRIVLGRVLHQTGSVTNGVLVIPAVTYGSTSNLLDFTRAFGPLKISGHVLAASGSTLSLTKTAGDSYAEGRNYTSDPDSPNIITSANDAALTVSKIYRQYLDVSGNVFTDTGIALAGYTTIDPTKYNTGGALAAVGNSEWTNQRVYWFPKAVNRALFVYYGQQKYPTFSDALAAISVETFTEGSNTAGSAIFVGTITVRGNSTSLADTDARITPSGLHRGASGGGGGGGQASAAGSTGYVQYNDSGVLGAESTFTYNSTTDTLSVPNITGSGIASFGTVSGSTVTGSTALFTTITASNYVGIQAGSIVAADGSGALQYNNPSGGTITGSTNLTFNGSTLSVTGSVIISGSSGLTVIGPTVLSGNVSIASTNRISSSNFVGNGSNLTNVVPSFSTKQITTVYPMGGDTSFCILGVVPTPIKQTGLSAYYNTTNGIGGGTEYTIDTNGIFARLKTRAAASLVNTDATTIKINSGVASQQVVSGSQIPTITTVLKTDTVINDQIITFGFTNFDNFNNGNGASAANKSAFINYDPSGSLDTTWKLVTINGSGAGAKTRADTGVTVSTGSIYNVAITLSGTEISCNINGTITTASATKPDGLMAPQIGVLLVSGSVQRSLYTKGFELIQNF